MVDQHSQIHELLQQRADFQARLNLIPYEGTPEVKEISGKKYLYTRKRIGSRLSSTYVGEYSEDLHQLLLKNTREARALRKEIRALDRELAKLGYADAELSARVQMNLDFARANLKANIYDQAVLEGVATTFPQTAEILENGIITGVSASDVQKILNLKHAWEFVLDKDVISYPTNYSILCHIAKLVNEGFYYDGGRIRGVPVTIGGTTYVPPLPIETVVKERIAAILTEQTTVEDKAINLCLYCMKAQIFNDGNKRAAVIFANHFLISQGGGMIIIPEKEVPEFKRLLVAYYEGRDSGEIVLFLKGKCLKRF